MSTMKTLTIADMREYFQASGHLYGTIEWALGHKEPFPTKLKKPSWNSDFTSKQAAEYAAKLEEWENESSKIRDKIEVVKSQYRLIDSVIEDWVKEYSGLTTIVPEKYRERVYQIAYDDGHSDGMMEVLRKLSSLVDIFNV